MHVGHPCIPYLAATVGGSPGVTLVTALRETGSDLFNISRPGFGFEGMYLISIYCTLLKYKNAMFPLLYLFSVALNSSCKLELGASFHFAMIWHLYSYLSNFIRDPI